jgi:hypothetical protein
MPTASEVQLTNIQNLSCFPGMEPSADLTGVFLLYSLGPLLRVRHLEAKPCQAKLLGAANRVAWNRKRGRASLISPLHSTHVALCPT